MSVTAALGFEAASAAAGLKSGGQTDIAVVVNRGPGSAAAAVFTSNRCKANPILWSQEAIKDGSAKAVAINSGGANCYTGPAGFQITHQTAERVAQNLGISAVDVQVASTGLIGLLNDRAALLDGVSRALDGLTAVVQSLDTASDRQAKSQDELKDKIGELQRELKELRDDVFASNNLEMDLDFEDLAPGVDTHS